MENNIQPCPFCGGNFEHIIENRVNKYGKPYKLDYYMHKNDDCILTQLEMLSGSYCLPNDRKIIEMWNTRKDKK